MMKISVDTAMDLAPLRHLLVNLTNDLYLLCSSWSLSKIQKVYSSTPTPTPPNHPKKKILQKRKQVKNILLYQQGKFVRYKMLDIIHSKKGLQIILIDQN